MTTAPSDFNYAKLFGIESVAAAVIFVFFYILLLLWFIRQSIRIPTYVHFVLVFFCVMRVTAFVTRTVLASSDSAGENLSLLIANQVFFNIGFFGLLYSAYTLVLDREILSGISISPTRFGIISRITRNRHIFRMCLMLSVALGIVGLTKSTGTHATQSDIDTGNALRKASTIIFLILTILQAFQTVVLATIEHKADYRPTDEPWAMRHATHILCVISVLLIVREAFFTATIGNTAQAGNEHLWYPLAATSELLCVILYAQPGLVPPKAALKKQQGESENEMMGVA